MALCAAIRPRSIGGSGSRMWSPTCAAGLRSRASASGICSAGSSTSLADLELAIEADLAGLAVDLGDDLMLLAVFAPRRGLDRLLHRDDHVVDADALLVGDASAIRISSSRPRPGCRLHAIVRHALSSFAPPAAAASRSSVSTSLAFLISAAGDRLLALRQLQAHLDRRPRPSRRPRKRRRPSIGIVRLDPGLEAARNARSRRAGPAAGRSRARSPRAGRLPAIGSATSRSAETAWLICGAVLDGHRRRGRRARP